jgi:lipocalin
MATKKCYQCKEEKDISEFWKDKCKSDGLQSACRTCSKKWRTNNPELYKIIDRKQKLKKNYNISIEKYNIMLKKQDYKCAICGKAETEQAKMLAVDHNHETNEIRGLLCDKCNRGLGYFNDNSEILQEAVNYLKK